MKTWFRKVGCILLSILLLWSPAWALAGVEEGRTDSPSHRRDALLVEADAALSALWSNRGEPDGTLGAMSDEANPLDGLVLETRPMLRRTAGPRLRSAGGESTYFLVELAPGADLEDCRSRLEGLQGVKSVCYDDYIYPADGYPEELVEPEYTESGCDPLLSQYSWQLDECGVTHAWTAMEELGMPGGRSEVLVAVLDTGVDYTHPDLRDGIWSGRGRNFYTADGTDPADPMDYQGHGTHCAGIIGARRNRIGVRGVAYNITILPVKVMGRTSTGGATGTVSALMQGIVYAVEQGASVLSMSLGVTADNPGLRACIDQFADEVIFVAAAGNTDRAVEGTGSQGWPNEPAAGAAGTVVTYPAAYPNVIGVMASQQADTGSGGYLAPYSRWDPKPGSGVEYEVIAPGSGIASTYLDGGYALMNGTSMAAPYVAGCCALLVSKYLEHGEGIPWIRALLLEHTRPQPGIRMGGVQYEFPQVNVGDAMDYREAVTLTLGEDFFVYDGGEKTMTAWVGERQVESGMYYQRPDGTPLDAPPSEKGRYAVRAVLDDGYWTGSAQGTMTIARLFDLDGDDAIGAGDAAVLSEVMTGGLPRAAGTRGREKAADFNGDGVIDFRDVYLLIRNLGWQAGG